MSQEWTNRDLGIHETYCFTMGGFDCMASHDHEVGAVNVKASAGKLVFQYLIRDKTIAGIQEVTAVKLAHTLSDLVDHLRETAQLWGDLV